MLPYWRVPVIGQDPPPGAQNERTALAWHRTALSVIVAAALVSRLAMTSIGPVAFSTLVVAVPVSVWIMLTSVRRYRRRLGWMHRVVPSRRDGRAEFGLAAVVMLLGVVEIAAVLG